METYYPGLPIDLFEDSYPTPSPARPRALNLSRGDPSASPSRPPVPSSFHLSSAGSPTGKRRRLSSSLLPAFSWPFSDESSTTTPSRIAPVASHPFTASKRRHCHLRLKLTPFGLLCRPAPPPPVALKYSERNAGLLGAGEFRLTLLPLASLLVYSNKGERDTWLPHNCPGR
ncbi:uncharacterized protein LOC125195135 [Salvia hispanica]|uniref:uncharacterized protein LOC125195135 n=1 Tax=Salvia hispanica TaxID=49212 RepID=UPI002008F881|nr:uncharacterized protein LOC125195135 [Salvia hispanica]